MPTPKAARAAASTAQEKAHNLAENITASSAEATQRLIDAGQQSAGQIGELLSSGMKASENVTKHATQSFDIMVQCGTVVADGVQSAMKEWVDCVQSCAQRNMSGFSDAMHARNMQDILAIQGRILRDDMEALLKTSVRISETSRKTGSAAAERFSECCEKSAYFKS